MSANGIYDSTNNFRPVSIPASVPKVRTTLEGLPLGVASDSQVAVKVMVVGKPVVRLSDLPTTAGMLGTLWNDNGNPRVSS